MIAHLSAPPYNTIAPYLASWTTYGQFGVELFFMISGFVIALSLQGKTFRDFVVTRFIRLFPIFWVCMGVSLVLRTFLVPSPQPVSLARVLAGCGQSRLHMP